MAAKWTAEFAEILMREVRDAAVRNCDMTLKPTATSVVALRWKAATAATSNLPLEMIPDCVDFTIFMLLRAIDQGVLQLKFVNNDGELVDLEAAGKGELGGMFMDSDGWRARYSKTRFVDDFKDM